MTGSVSETDRNWCESIIGMIDNRSLITETAEKIYERTL